MENARHDHELFSIAIGRRPSVITLTQRTQI